jgi:hydrogenase maturation protein HypF
MRPSRRYLRVRGLVQGVGFRPFVFQLAETLGLSGWVRNDSHGVEIEIQGSPSALEEFEVRLQRDKPPLAQIDRLETHPRPTTDEREFRIVPSETAAVATGAVTPDAGTCDACLGELFEPMDRRYRYAFINCTHCGPRYTITRALPYDRVNTSMSRFPICATCKREYDDPRDRRFHAQPNACPDCGPRLELLEPSGRTASEGDCIAETVSRLTAGQIIAIKGLGGFHLACDASNPTAVARLRERKQREEKPFAIMVASAASLGPLVQYDASARNLLEQPTAPIVLLHKTPDCDSALPGVAPGLGWLGVMLPYTPLHYLLFHEAAGRPGGLAWLGRPHQLRLVMTSANPGGQPLVITNEEALERLGTIADALLVHDRDILVRCDDSVVRCNHGAPAFIRRGRGYTPRAIRLPASGPAVLACGGWYKNTICLTRGDEAFISQHIGDLDNAPTCLALEQVAHHLMQVLDIVPERVAHDFHPDFFSSRYAQRFAQDRRLPLVAVQHHHAHAAAIAAEHLLAEPHLALTLDGVGLGTDGQAWGGELLHVDGARFERIGHLTPLALPGGDRAAREPWRMGASALHALGRTDEISDRYRRSAAPTVQQMLARSLNTPMTSSAGRLFDAAAGLLGVRDIAAYEAQAAMLLEGIAETCSASAPLADGYAISATGELDFRPTLAALAGETDPRRGAAYFHATVAQGLADWATEAAHATGLHIVVVGGGCLLNSLVSTSLRAILESRGIRVLAAQLAPPNDGGLSLGQAWVALQTP